MKFIIGKKLQMSQIFKETGEVVPVTMVQAGPCVVTQIRNLERDGYAAVQVGFEEVKKVNKSKAGHLQGLRNLRNLKEFRVDPQQLEQLEKGQEITVNVFEAGDKVKVTGTSKGKGFAGVVKRYGFAGQSTSHGVKDQVRMPGSSGATGPARVFKGKKNPGRMGGVQVTVANLEIVKVDGENNILYIKGAVPGARNGLVYIVAEGGMDLNIKPQKEVDASGDAVTVEENSQVAKGESATDAEKNSEVEEVQKDEISKEVKEKVVA